ncbi:MAG TPA: hypothetical protein PLV19_04160 [Nitrosomonas sp.]|nr:hypothetical protein [Nitrosomonas sp.]HQX13349.1 hypothetical protein [Nitrosomonas sp.]HRB21569.1 hypothetical protein [Nitrosomonas sp.]HRB31740.1 hypothetical protein [Nitrosomonas sp.]HRB44420.1 hypothetical protein [Nitrosomonas sp.]
MNFIPEYFKRSEFALAAYANLTPGVDPIPALQDNNVGMSSSQAAAFVEKWKVVAQTPYSITGLSATVFEEINSGAKYLAIRDTEITDPGDLFAGNFWFYRIAAAICEP